ncbi:carboxymethylenebutenolidase homolog [Acridotheres tristis]
MRVVGQELQVEHIKVYICKPPASTGKSVIVIHDMFGWQLPNTRYMADMLTTNGYTEADAVLKYLREQRGAKKLRKILFSSFLGLIKVSDDISNLMTPKFFIFAEKDDFMPLHQIC